MTSPAMSDDVKSKPFALELCPPAAPKNTKAFRGKRVQTYATPWHIVDAVAHDSFGGAPFALDVAAKASTSKALAFYGLPHGNGLRDPWLDGSWCNPPYDEQQAWLARAHWHARKGVHSACLVLASTSTLYWRPLVWETATVDFFEARIAFLDEATGEPARNNSLASALVLIGPRFLPGVVRVRSAETGRLLARLPQGVLPLE